MHEMRARCFGLRMGLGLWHDGNRRPTGTAYRYWALFSGFLSASVSANFQLAEIEFRESIGGPNAAVSGTAISSSSFSGSFLPANAFDNNTSTIAALSGKIGYIGYDFGNGAQKVIRQVSIKTSTAGTQGPKTAVLCGSNDGTDWTAVNVLSFNGGAALADSTQYTVGVTELAANEPALSPTAAHRYWRFRSEGLGVESNDYQAIREIKLLGAADEDLCITKGGTASADTFQSAPFSPSKCFDRNTSTYWADSAQKTPHWIRWDFGAGNAQVVLKYAVVARNDSSPRTFRLQCSDDGVNFKTVHWVVFGPAKTDFQETTYTI